MRKEQQQQQQQQQRNDNDNLHIQSDDVVPTGSGRDCLAVPPFFVLKDLCELYDTLVHQLNSTKAATGNARPASSACTTTTASNLLLVCYLLLTIHRKRQEEEDVEVVKTEAGYVDRRGSNKKRKMNKNKRFILNSEQESTVSKTFERCKVMLLRSHRDPTTTSVEGGGDDTAATTVNTSHHHQANNREGEEMSDDIVRFLLDDVERDRTTRRGTIIDVVWDRALKKHRWTWTTSATFAVRKEISFAELDWKVLQEEERMLIHMANTPIPGE